MALLLALPACHVGCGSERADETTDEVRTSRASTGAEDDRPSHCPAQAAAPERLPHVRPEHETLDYWLARSEAYGDLDATLLSPVEIRAHVRAITGAEPQRSSLGAPADVEALRAELDERLTYVRERFEDGGFLAADGSRLPPEAVAAVAMPPTLAVQPSLRVAVEPIPLRCTPRAEGYYTPSLDLDFDRNACSLVRAQEPIELLATWPNGMRLARTRYALGWIDADAALSPEVPSDRRARVLDGPRGRLEEDTEVRVSDTTVRLPAGSFVPLVSPAEPTRPRSIPRAASPAEAGVDVASRQGFAIAPRPARLTTTERALTRRAFLADAFALLGSPYGWGGRAGGRDCSRYVLDVFAAYGLHLPRHSARQATAGSYVIDVEGMGRAEKALLLEEAQRKGVVMLHFPGHVMLYLGRDDDGRPFAIHSFSEYLEPCEGTEDDEGRPLETLRRVDRVAISDLSLGEGSTRTDFLSRVTRVVVFGQPPGVELGGAATLRPAAPVSRPEECSDHLDARIFRSPWRPTVGRSLRVLVSVTDDPGSVELALFDPRGERVDAPVRALGGPPYARWAEVERPREGLWTAVLGDGERVVACKRIPVARHGPEPEARGAEAPAWEPLWSWERDTENLYAAFVEQLFREPEGEETTWPSLQALIADRERNLLYDHRMLGEDERLDLRPDCADLPYFLRAYFAWKLRLPFAWRQCSRGREGRPPMCPGAVRSNVDPYPGRDEVAAFQALIRDVARNVHSSSNRTLPADDDTDVYPVPLTREGLRPGAVFADPYGHILVVVRWTPQTTESYGMLLAADAQPDAVVGRRRFWRGSFLFSPETTEAGAGFKAWRPVVYDRQSRSVSLLSNEALRRTRDHVPWSDQQYRGSADDFYEAMDALINPRALDPRAVQASLVDALEESVVRRVVSVDTGEEYMRGRGFRAIDMPDGADIFLTAGAWEDFSTPSRDLRLLVSIDAVTGLPDVVSRSPERFGVDARDAEAVAQGLRGWLDEELARRRFTYTRSDGEPQSLTLADVVARARALEMAYNPNDCVEIRWGAPEGSDERRSCRRQAPADQRAKMARYRAWFENRHRPAR